MSEEFSGLHQIVFFVTFGLLVVLERIGALQRGRVQVSGRWTANIGLLIIVGIVGALAVPVTTHSFAYGAEHGLLAGKDMPVLLQVVVTVLLMDMCRYWEHRLFHSVPALWRLHLVHHSDTQLDVTTTERHHPLEAVLTTMVMWAVVVSFGLPAVGVGVYVLIATVVAFSSHANLRLPESCDRVLRWVIVTPAVHAVHHSSLKAETNANYGAVFSIWDRIFGSFVDPQNASIPYFGLEYFHRTSDTGLARVLLQPILYRPNMAYPVREAPASEFAPSSFTISAAWRHALWAGLVGYGLVAVALWPTVAHVATIWSTEAYQYAWLVMPMMAYLLIGDRNRILALDPEPGPGGVILAASGALVWSLATLLNIDAGRHLAAVMTIHGIALAMVGWHSYRRLFPILALLFFAIPSSDVLQPILRLATLKSVELFADAAGLPYSVEGFLVFVGSHRYIVIDECSGLSYVTLAAFLGYSFGLLLYRSFPKIAALTVLGAIFGFLANIVRVNSIILIDWLRGSQMDLSGHGGMQWAGLFLTVGLLLLTLFKLKPDKDQSQTVAVSGRENLQFNPLAPVFAGAFVAVIIGGASAITNNTPYVLRPESPSKSPVSLVGWTPASPEVQWTRDAHRDVHLLRMVLRKGGKEIDVLIVEAGSPNAKLPKRLALNANSEGWHEGQTTKETICAQSQCRSLLHTTLHIKGQDPRHVYYNYRIGGFETTSELALRVAHGWHRLTRSDEKPRLMALAFRDSAHMIEEFVGAFSALESLLDFGEPSILHPHTI